MGRVYTEVTITNRADEIRAGSGLRDQSEVRSLLLPEVLVDTGANTLCLPQSMIEELGLARLRTVPVMTATGPTEADLYQDAKLTVLGRSGTVECLALPDGTEPLLGLIPLEVLGLQPDLQNERLVALPESGRDTHFTVL